MKLLIIDNPDSWHVNDLRRAADSEHDITTATYNEMAVAFSSNINEQSSFTIGSQPLGSFEAILTRAMPASSLEQIVFRMDALNQIERQLGIPIINPARTIESSVDKYLSLELIRQMELPVPETHVSQTADHAMSFFTAMGNQTVIKPIFGSQGRGLALVKDPNTAMHHFSELEKAGRVIYQQRFINHGGEDIRVLVNGGQTFAIKRKRPDHWITNASHGATCEPHELDPLEQELAMAASHSQGAFLAGIDIAYESGMPYILEVNACPSWKHLSSALNTDVSAAVLYMINRMAGYSDE